ncbi:unnamed protein product [Closterium sp. Naga37s-1]|nr:unnamed protein product [Closterium sp. Naga37s-1]
MASTIGRRLAELHSALAAPADDPAFSPERADSAQAQQHAAQAIATLHDALRVLAEHRRGGGGKLDGRTLAAAYADADAEWLENHVEPLTQAIRERAYLEQDSLYLRIHGDFHLGQVLVARGTDSCTDIDDACLVDFEGELARPFAERRTKTTPLRDVAGLLRSFDYAAAVLSSPGPLGSALLTTCATETLGIVNKPMGYHAVAHQAPHPWLKPGAEQRLLELSLLERAAYEVCYEAAHRPDWLWIPAAGLAELARGILASPSSEKETHES